MAVATRDEVVGYIRDQGGFALRRTLMDIGVTLDTQRTYGAWGCRVLRHAAADALWLRLAAAPHPVRVPIRPAACLSASAVPMHQLPCSCHAAWGRGCEVSHACQLHPAVSPRAPAPPVKSASNHRRRRHPAGSPACVREAAALAGPGRRLLRVVDLLSQPDALRDAALTTLGNLGVQRLFEGLARLRAAYPPGGSSAGSGSSGGGGGDKKAQRDLEAWRAAHGDKDPYSEAL